VVKWQMDFNIEKCEVMHCGRSNSYREYTINRNILRRVDEERDLGVTSTQVPKAAVQVDKVVKKTYGMLSFIE